MQELYRSQEASGSFRHLLIREPPEDADVLLKPLGPLQHENAVELQPASPWVGERKRMIQVLHLV
jgi:hypothetical protein